MPRPAGRVAAWQTSGAQRFAPRDGLWRLVSGAMALQLFSYFAGAPRLSRRGRAAARAYTVILRRSTWGRNRVAHEATEADLHRFHVVRFRASSQASSPFQSSRTPTRPGEANSGAGEADFVLRIHGLHALHVPSPANAIAWRGSGCRITWPHHPLMVPHKASHAVRPPPCARARMAPPLRRLW